ncbi:unnamed protein product [Strongylus vulgaris]|uniref:Uncharacterized protein n=1 Tax=Strongylus vulgaris TaxID=40348 RepID=A0A3P7KHD3_STRVU|nr:unnamed protein product [Strongylus vulgaris]
MGLAHLPSRRWNRPRGDSTPISSARQHPGKIPLFPLEKYHRNPDHEGSHGSETGPRFGRFLMEDIAYTRNLRNI